MVVVVGAVGYAVDVRGVEFFSAGGEGAEEGEDVVLRVAADPGAVWEICSVLIPFPFRRIQSHPNS